MAAGSRHALAAPRACGSSMAEVGPGARCARAPAAFPLPIQRLVWHDAPHNVPAPLLVFLQHVCLGKTRKAQGTSLERLAANRLYQREGLKPFPVSCQPREGGRAILHIALSLAVAGTHRSTPEPPGWHLSTGAMVYSDSVLGTRYSGGWRRATEML